MSKPTERAKQAALALAFGVVMQGSMVSGIPGGIPGLSRALSCGSCTMSLSKGVPTQFAAVMTEEQKRRFKAELKKRK